MKRKDDAEERKQTEQVLQKSLERTHWTETRQSSDDPLKEKSNKPKLKFIVEYDNTASGINSVVSGSTGASTAFGRLQFGRKKEEKEESEINSKTQPPQAKIPKFK